MMAAGKLEPLICDIPFELWPTLDFSMDHSLQDLYGLNMPGLRRLTIDSTTISHLPYGGLKNVHYLTLYGGTFGEIEVFRLPDIKEACFYWTTATFINAHDCVDMTNLNFTSSANLTSVNIENCASLRYLNGSGCALNLDAINHITYHLMLNGVVSGSLDLRYGSNSPPSHIAETHIASLISRGWTVYTN